MNTGRKKKNAFVSRPFAVSPCCPILFYFILFHLVFTFLFSDWPEFGLGVNYDRGGRARRVGGHMQDLPLGRNQSVKNKNPLHATYIPVAVRWLGRVVNLGSTVFPVFFSFLLEGSHVEGKCSITTAVALIVIEGGCRTSRRCVTKPARKRSPLLLPVDWLVGAVFDLGVYCDWTGCRTSI